VLLVKRKQTENKQQVTNGMEYQRRNNKRNTSAVAAVV
jgi:hypothetical protein